MILAQLKSGRFIIGLGNPSPNYAKSRHNIGKVIVGSLESGYLKKINFNPQFNPQHGFKVFRAYVLENPKTFMNESGKTIGSFIKSQNVSPKNILVVHDDLDLPFPYVHPPQFGRGSAGHKGVQSIIDTLGTKDFYRIRVGVGPRPTGPVDEFVIDRFSNVEEKQLKGVIEDAKEKIVDWDEEQAKVVS